MRTKLTVIFDTLMYRLCVHLETLFCLELLVAYFTEVTSARGFWLDDISSSGEVRHIAVALVTLEGVPTPVNRQLKYTTNKFMNLPKCSPTVVAG